MANKDRATYNVFMKIYMKARHKSRRQEAIALLGGSCVFCRSTERLEFDHVVPEDKSFTIGSNWSYAWNDVLEELKKCQLLCHDCHVEKHRNRNHGTLTGYTHYKCRCADCSRASREYNKQYKLSKKLGSLA